MEVTTTAAIELLHYFRPGEEARMLARCQFNLARDGGCGAHLTYPIKGYPWRRNPVRMHQFKIPPEEAEELFHEVAEMPQRFPEECRADDVLWSDDTEKANGVTRDAEGMACHTLAIYQPDGTTRRYFSMREDSPALRASKLFATVCRLIGPLERLDGADL